MFKKYSIYFEYALIGATLLLAGISHGNNMFHFPYFENDEGAYMSQAWSLLTQGKLAPYTYWYDHAPAGWIFISLWTVLTFGFHTFGFSLYSGRIFMLVIHLLSAFIIIRIAKRLTNSVWPGVIAALIFSFSPLAIYYQRRILLDNMMVLWVLVSLWLLISSKLRLRKVLASGVVFGIAVLTKENAIFFLPAYLYCLYYYTHPEHRRLAIVNWLACCFLVVSLYFLYALVHSELFPVSLGGERVSLITTLQQQFNRGTSLPFWNKSSDFYVNFGQWYDKDPTLLLLGLFGTLFTVILSFAYKQLRVLALMVAMFWLFLIRGKLVLDFYIIPLIPFIALCFAVSVWFVANVVSFRNRFVYTYLMIACCLAVMIQFLLNPIGQYTKDETTSQLAGLQYVLRNVPKESHMAIDNFAFIELKEAGYTNADWFWKMWDDPEVKEKFDNNWKEIEYIFLTHEMLKQMEYRQHSPDVLRQTLQNSRMLAYYPPSETTFVDFNKLRSTNGDWSAVFQRKSLDEIDVNLSWSYFKKQFVHEDGRVTLEDNALTNSEMQSEVLLRAIWQDDRETFDRVWRWTKDHLQTRIQDRLMSRLWVEEEESGRVVDGASSAVADEDIALALLFAYSRWDNGDYLIAAEEIVKDIWKQEVVQINGRYYITNGTDSEKSTGYLVTPAYFSPATYRIFAQIDPENSWIELANSTYTFLDAITKQGNQLPPERVIVDKRRGTVLSAESFVGSETEYFGAFGSKIPWRLYMDSQWFGTAEAHEYLLWMADFYGEEWEFYNNISAFYSLNRERYGEVATIGNGIGALASSVSVQKSNAQELYEGIYKDQFNAEIGYWGNYDNYSDQYWGWMGNALYNGKLVNIWDVYKNEVHEEE